MGVIEHFFTLMNWMNEIGLDFFRKRTHWSRKYQKYEYYLKGMKFCETGVMRGHVELYGLSLRSACYLNQSSSILNIVSGLLVAVGLQGFCITCNIAHQHKITTSHLQYLRQYGPKKINRYEGSNFKVSLKRNVYQELLRPSLEMKFFVK